MSTNNQRRNLPDQLTTVFAVLGLMLVLIDVFFVDIPSFVIGGVALVASIAYGFKVGRRRGVAHGIFSGVIWSILPLYFIFFAP